MDVILIPKIQTSFQTVHKVRQFLIVGEEAAGGRGGEWKKFEEGGDCTIEPGINLRAEKLQRKCVDKWKNLPKIDYKNNLQRNLSSTITTTPK